MKLFDKTIGDGFPACLIVECGINHCGSFSRAIEMVDVAKKVGADVVKFQKRDMGKLYRGNVLAHPSDASHSLGVYIPILKQCELSEGDHVKIKAYCERIGIHYLCSPWDIASVDFLESIKVEAYKIPSACFSDVYLMEHIEQTGKPVIMSSGMHTEPEINELMPGYIEMFKDRLALLHCTSSYPTPNKDVNLNYIKKLKERFPIPIGFSGHEKGVPITVASVAIGANIIERHFTLDRTLPGPDHAASLEPHGVEEMIRHIRAVEEALGDEKSINRGEVMARETLGKILTWSKDHKYGDIVDKKSFSATSPGYGIPANMAYKFNDGRHYVDIKNVRAGEPVMANEILLIKPDGR